MTDEECQLLDGLLLKWLGRSAGAQYTTYRRRCKGWAGRRTRIYRISRGSAKRMAVLTAVRGSGSVRIKAR